MKKVTCASCQKEVYAEDLWVIDYLGTNAKTALKLREANKICCTCWMSVIGEWDAESLTSLAEDLMLDLHSSHQEYEILEKESEETITALKEEVEELSDKLSDIKNNIDGILG